MLEQDMKRVLRQTYEKLPITSQDTTTVRPPYPYIALKFTNLGTKVHKQAREMQNGMMQYKQVTEPTLSVSCYSDKELDAVALAQLTAEYFEVDASLLHEQGLVVVDTSDVTDRTVFKEVAYEYRYGFDVTLRIVAHAERDLGTIETVNITGGTQ